MGKTRTAYAKKVCGKRSKTSKVWLKTKENYCELRLWPQASEREGDVHMPKRL